MTGTGTANTLNGESGLTYDGTTLAVAGDITLGGTAHRVWGSGYSTVQLDTSAMLYGNTSSISTASNLYYNSGWKHVATGAISLNVNEAGYHKFYTGASGSGGAAAAFVERLSISPAGNVVINDTGVDADFRVESDGNANMLFVDGGTNRVGVGLSNPIRTLHVADNSADPYVYVDGSAGNRDSGFSINAGAGQKIAVRGDVGGTLFYGNENQMSTTSTGTVFNESSADLDFRVESTDNANMLFVDGGNNRVGIGTASPSGELHVDSGLAPCDIHFTTGSSGGTGYDVNLNMNGGANNSEMNLNMGIAGNADREQIKTYQSTMRFTTADIERMRIGSTGNIHINKTDVNQTTTLGFDLYANGTVLSTHTVSSNESWIINNYNGSGTSRFDFRWNNQSRGGIDVTATATSFDTNSDYRLKENVDYTWDATTRLKQLKPARFNWIADDTNTLVDGFLAHEVTSVVPNAVSGTKDGMYDSEHDLAGQEKYQGIDHSKLVPLLVKTIQELEARITALES
jgi:hypothetical protein